MIPRSRDETFKVALIRTQLVVELANMKRATGAGARDSPTKDRYGGKRQQQPGRGGRRQKPGSRG